MNAFKYIATCTFALWLVACTTAQGPVGTDAIVVLKSGS
jgi:hypothetical protein